jgi:hypothetical protein
VIPALSCRACRPHAPFAELVKLSPTSIAGDSREERRQRVLGNKVNPPEALGPPAGSSLRKIRVCVLRRPTCRARISGRPPILFPETLEPTSNPASFFNRSHRHPPEVRSPPSHPKTYGAVERRGMMDVTACRFGSEERARAARARPPGGSNSSGFLPFPVDMKVGALT